MFFIVNPNESRYYFPCVGDCPPFPFKKKIFDAPERVSRMAPIVEKRRYKRFEFKEEVRVFPVLPSSSGNIFEVQQDSVPTAAFDISEGGLRMKWVEDLNPEFLLKLNFQFSKDLPVEVYGKIVWSQEKECGVRFMVPDAAIRHGVKSLSAKKA